MCWCHRVAVENTQWLVPCSGRRIGVTLPVGAVRGVGAVMGRGGDAGSSRYKRLVTRLKARLPLPTHNLSIHHTLKTVIFQSALYEQGQTERRFRKKSLRPWPASQVRPSGHLLRLDHVQTIKRAWEKAILGSEPFSHPA
ncbi:unnamed protein product [Rangifer tarandus platyrhynchus]|uniref:Uncharacterized protein n=2 Tax=Rangifer tarandus platyrhynchus TaxID=3082113 RepID=A0ACB0EL10_RANTA|nr:unnamed protein product [Rangifer tarandus platyrhynchus]CAI9701335.1 unnamed protein product [Rangifer tarandus platyrhynchus]